MNLFKKKISIFALLLVSLSGCDLIPEENIDSTIIPSEVTAIISTSDYRSSSISIITGDDNRISVNNLLPSESGDATVNSYNNDFYVIDKSAASSITKFNTYDLNNPVWNYSTQDSANSVTTNNPYQIVFLNESKAYILLYGSNKVWIVNPSALLAADFKIGEIDLSAYADADGLAEITMGVIAKGKLFIVAQRQENWAPIDAYLAVIDTTTDIEIDTDPTLEGLKGIKLQVKNPNNDIQYLAADNAVYIQAYGSYSITEFEGGIEKIDVDNYASSLIIDDGTASTHPNEKVAGMVIVSPEIGYYTSEISYGKQTLYQFNPKTGEESLSAFTEADLGDIAIDKNGLVWIADASNQSIYILDPSTNTVIDSVITGLAPRKITFVNP